MKYILISIYISLLASFIGCKKETQQKKGYTLIKTIKNTLSTPVEVKLAWWVRNNVKIDSFRYRPSVYLSHGESWRTDSSFICVENCESVRNAPDPNTGVPIMIEFIIDNKVKIDTNCWNGVISNFPDLLSACLIDKKNYFNDKHHIRTENKEKNIVRDEYLIDAVDLSEAK